MAGELLHVTRSCAIPLDELEWRFVASGGPGGQHANRSNTKAELRFDIAQSPSLGPRQRARLLETFGPVLRVVVDAERSQTRNRALALQRLAARLANALTIATPRRPTRPTAGSQERRLQEKRRHAEQKRQRQRPRGDDG